ncbi:hypothetical protein AB2B41_10090 [Marimonas sp. MJW-29]|uniref:DUF4440 domain-containing protein n=1 Tax=Sulfitobacter sediminis TaxID=3234186 RepID=A0ABV3RLU8_9RHOB
MFRTVSLIAALLVSSGAAAQHAQHQSGHHSGHSEHHQGVQHGQHQSPGNLSAPRETGQDAFAALSEVVTLLSNDPDTDWSKVDMDGLRAHLLDMDRLTMSAQADTLVEPDRVRFVVTGEGDVAGSVQRMVSAHGGMLAEETGWEVTTEITVNGAEMVIVPGDASGLARVKALGFFGVMTVGAHHQVHHLAIAQGRDPHH